MKDIKILTSEGYNYLGNNRFFLAPSITVLTLFNEIFKNNSLDFVRDSIKNSGEIDAYLIYDYLFNKYSSKNILLKYFAEFISYFGFGKFELSRVSKNEIIFSQSKPTFKNLYFKIFGKVPNFYFTELNCGIISYFLSNLYKKKVNTEFIVKGDMVYFRNDILEENYEFTGDKKIKLPKNLDQLKLNSRTNFSISSRGVNYFGDTLMVFLPSCLYFDLLDKIMWSSDYNLNTAESIGKLMYVKMKKKNFPNVKDDFSLFENKISSLGFGNICFLNKSYNKISILKNFKKNLNCKNIDDSNIIFFIASLYKGFYDSIYDVTTKIRIDGNCVTLVKVTEGCELTDINLMTFKNINLKV